MKKKLLVALGIVAVILMVGFLFITDGLSEGARVSFIAKHLENKNE